MSSAVAEKTAEELRKEIEELQRQQREISERLRDPRGLRRAGVATGGPRPNAPPRVRGVIRPATVESEDQPTPKRRLSSAVVRLEDGEIKEGASGADADKEEDPLAVEAGVSAPPAAALAGESGSFGDTSSQINGVFRRDANPGMRRKDFDILPEPEPRVFPKNEDPSLAKRNQRMLKQLLGTLQKFSQEHEQSSTSEAYMRRSDSLRRAEEKAREESERLRQQEREQIAEKRRRDLTLRARVAAKAEEKKLELLFINWSEHHKKLCNFQRTKAQPPIYFMPTKPLVDDGDVIEKLKEQEFLEWRSTRRDELSDYQKQIGEQYLTNVDTELNRWQNARNARRANNNSTVNLQETMDKELETHRLEHGPKTRRIPGTNDEEEDVEDIAAEDELMDEVLEEAHERIDGEGAKIPSGNGSPGAVEIQ